MPLYHCLHTNPFADMPIELTATRPISISLTRLNSLSGLSRQTRRKRISADDDAHGRQARHPEQPPVLQYCLPSRNAASAENAVLQPEAA